MIKAIIFDLDHTLFDRHATLRAIAPQFRKFFHVSEGITDDEIADMWIYADDRYVYDGWEYIFAYLKENGVFVTPPKYDDYRSFVFNTFSKTAVRFDFTLPMLKGLKKDGYKVALITNGRHELQYKKLVLTGMRYIFDEIIVSGDVGVEKPDREIFMMMCEKLGVKPSECVYVGDNPFNDIGGAKRAGMYTFHIKTVYKNPKAPAADAEIATVGEVPQALTALKAKIEAGQPDLPENACK